MILTGNEVQRQVEAGNIVFDPFDIALVNPNSIDLRLSSRLLRYLDATIDPRVEANTTEVLLDEQGLSIPAGTFLLGSSIERVGSTAFVPLVHGKSSTARAGLFVHVTADLIDIGSIGNVTFQLYFVLPLRIYPGMRIGQITFWKPQGAIRLYDGKYQGSVGPQKSRIYRDPFWQTF
jgi:dCTP deaminase